MRALLYLFVTSLKNRFFELLHKPAKLILYLLCIGGMAAVMLPQFFVPPSSTTAQMDLIWLKGVYFALAAFFVVIAVQKGLSNGDIIFQMQDVNLLFVSPISPKTILLYGITQMAKGAFWAGFFILFMGNVMRQFFGKGFGSILILFFSFILAIVLLSTVSLVLYNLTNGRPRRKLWVRLAAAAIFAPAAVVFCIQMAQTGQLMSALENTLRSPVLSWTPVAGWGAESTTALVGGDAQTGFLFLGVMVAAGAALIAYILLGNIDYYEDVLVATETAFEKNRAIAEGQTNPEALSGGKTRVVKTGVGGVGASAFFYKHLRESTRASVLGLLSWNSIITIASAGVLAVFLRGEGEACSVILQILMWMQIFMVGMGRGLKETTTHYIYLIPEPSSQKIVWSNLEPVARVLLESVLLFGLAGLIGGEPPIVVLGCIAVYTFFSMMLIGVNYLSMRWFGAELGNGILLTLYFIVVVVLMLPGLVAMFFGFNLGGVWGTAAGLGILAVWELLVALACFALSKGVLHRCDIQTPGK